MAIEITGRHIDITDVVKDYARKRVERLNEEFPRLQSVHVILDVEKYRHMAEVVVHGRAHGQVAGRETSGDMYASIDAAIDKVERQLRKNRERMVEHRGAEKLGDAQEAEPES